MKIALTPMEKFRAAGKFLDVKLNQRPLSRFHRGDQALQRPLRLLRLLEVITDRDEMLDYVDVVRRFDPLVVVFTGGEPLLRRDLVPIIQQIRDIPGFRYITVLTHGGFLTEAKIKELVAAGTNQINISMNYPDERQDKERGIPGLFDRLSKTVPKMVSAGLQRLHLCLDADGRQHARRRAAHPARALVGHQHRLQRLQRHEEREPEPLRGSREAGRVPPRLRPDQAAQARARQRHDVGLLLRHAPDLLQRARDQGLPGRQDHDPRLAEGDGPALRRAAPGRALQRVRACRLQGRRLQQVLRLLPRRAASAAHHAASRRADRHRPVGFRSSQAGSERELLSRLVRLRAINSQIAVAVSI